MHIRLKIKSWGQEGLQSSEKGLYRGTKNLMDTLSWAQEILCADGRTFKKVYHHCVTPPVWPGVCSQTDSQTVNNKIILSDKTKGSFNIHQNMICILKRISFPYVCKSLLFQLQRLQLGLFKQKSQLWTFMHYWNCLKIGTNPGFPVHYSI